MWTGESQSVSGVGQWVSGSDPLTPLALAFRLLLLLFFAFLFLGKFARWLQYL